MKAMHLPYNKAGYFRVSCSASIEKFCEEIARVFVHSTVASLAAATVYEDGSYFIDMNNLPTSSQLPTYGSAKELWEDFPEEFRVGEPGDFEGVLPAGIFVPLKSKGLSDHWSFFIRVRFTDDMLTEFQLRLCDEEFLLQHIPQLLR